MPIEDSTNGTGTTPAAEAGAIARPNWLQMARDAHLGSTSYFDSSIRRQIEQDLLQFQGEHPLGSKYRHDSYRLRSRLFRPKTRGAIRKNEAVAAEALFSTRDVISIEPQNESNPEQRASAALWQQVMQHRLTKSIPWFLTSMASYQEAQSIGVVCSYQSWRYSAKKGIDKPCIELVPIENIRFDPGAKWWDPVNTSPYWIEMIPMYVKDVQALQRTRGWSVMPAESLRRALTSNTDSTRQVREGRERQDPSGGGGTTAITAFSTVWVHRNIVEWDEVDYVYYTLGTIDMLSNPVPLETEYPHGMRPYVMGIACIEAHKNYPGGVARLTRDTQAEINDLGNLRIDNIRFTLNKRYFVRRGRAVDTRALGRNAPGSSVLMDDPNENGDVRIVDYADVTSSSFNEQDRLNIDFDEVAGAFSPASVQSNRRLNETVGGMNILTTNANQVSAYQLKTWVETWVEPVLAQVLALEQHLESDDMILMLAGERAQLVQKFGVSAITDALLRQQLTMTVGVGMGATNPTEIVNQLITSLGAIRDMLSDGILMKHGLVLDELIAEIFGNLGYSDGKRFFDTEGGDMRIKALVNMVEELQAELEAKTPPELLDAQIRHIEAQIENLSTKNLEGAAKTTKTNVESTYSAMQAAQVAAAVPEVAEVADGILNWAGGEEMNLDVPEATPAGITVQPLVNKRTGIETQQRSGAGKAAGIETPAADGIRAA